MKGISMPVEGREIFYLLLKHLKGSVNSTWQSAVGGMNMHAASTAAELQLKRRQKTGRAAMLAPGGALRTL